MTRSRAASPVVSREAAASAFAALRVVTSSGRKGRGKRSSAGADEQLVSPSSSSPATVETSESGVKKFGIVDALHQQEVEDHGVDGHDELLTVSVSAGSAVSGSMAEEDDQHAAVEAEQASPSPAAAAGSRSRNSSRSKRRSGQRVSHSNEGDDAKADEKENSDEEEGDNNWSDEE